MINKSFSDVESNQSSSLMGEKITIEGYLRVRDDLISVEVSNNEEKVAFLITDPTVLDRLLDSAPCYLGGEFLFNDYVKMIGFLSGSGKNLVISSVESGVLLRDNESYTF